MHLLHQQHKMGKKKQASKAQEPKQTATKPVEIAAKGAAAEKVAQQVVEKKLEEKKSDLSNSEKSVLATAQLPKVQPQKSQPHKVAVKSGKEQKPHATESSPFLFLLAALGVLMVAVGVYAYVNNIGHHAASKVEIAEQAVSLDLPVVIEEEEAETTEDLVGRFQFFEDLTTTPILSKDLLQVAVHMIFPPVSYACLFFLGAL